MFFSRSKPLATPSRGTVAVVGLSPLAFLLADAVQANNFSAVIVAQPKDVAKKHLPSCLTIQSFSLQSHSADFTFSTTLPEADFCFIASRPEDARQDLVFLPKEALREKLVVNFSHLFTHRLTEEMGITNFIPAYADYWTSWERNILKLLSRKTELTLHTSTKTLSKLDPLFENSLISLSGADPKKNIFWHNMIPYALSSLILLSSKEKNITALLQRQEIREHVSAAAKELCRIAKRDKETVNETDVFSKLYMVPEAYRPEVSSLRAFHALLNLLPEVDKFNTPELFKLVTAANKY